MATTTAKLLERACAAQGVHIDKVTLRKSQGVVKFNINGTTTLAQISKVAEILGTTDIEWDGRSDSVPVYYDAWCIYTANGVDIPNLRARLEAL